MQTLACEFWTWNLF